MDSSCIMNYFRFLFTSAPCRVRQLGQSDVQEHRVCCTVEAQGFWRQDVLLFMLIKPRKAYSAWHPSGVGKWVPAIAGEAKAGMAHSDCGWTCGCAGKTVKSLENTCHTWALLRWWFTTKRRYIKCMHLYLYHLLRVTLQSIAYTLNFMLQSVLLRVEKLGTLLFQNWGPLFRWLAWALLYIRHCQKTHSPWSVLVDWTWETLVIGDKKNRR